MEKKSKLTDSLANTKEIQRKLEGKIRNILENAGTGDLKIVRALAEVLNLIKKEYVSEEERLNKNYDKERPVGKIIIYFTKQIYLNLYIVYSIKYINTINFQFTPEFRKKFIEDTQKYSEMVLEYNKKAGNGKKLPELKKSEAGLDGLDGFVGNPMMGTPVGGHPMGGYPMGSYPMGGYPMGEARKKNEGMKGALTNFDAGKERDIIIEMLKEYEIQYDTSHSNYQLLLTLKNGLEELIGLITKSINTGPENINMLKNLQVVRGNLEG